MSAGKEVAGIYTPRLYLRPLCGEDGTALADATAQSWGDISRWMRWATDFDLLTSPDNCRAYSAACHEKFAQGRDFTFAGFDRRTGTFVLIIRLAWLDRAAGIMQFCGYWCRTTYQNQGLMAEGVRGVLEYALSQLGAHGFEITHAAGNFKSRAVIEKLGFELTDIRKHAHELPDGTYVDEYVYWLQGRDVPV